VCVKPGGGEMKNRPSSRRFACLCKVNAVKFQIFRSSNGDDSPSGCTARCGAECVVVVDMLLHFEALYDETSFES